jgi:hypothetical protein
MIEFDRALFGRLPTTILQDALWTGSLQWYDQVLAVIQRAHFFVPPHAAVRDLAGAAASCTTGARSRCSSCPSPGP